MLNPMANVLVTGQNGFVGKHVVNVLQAKGHFVYNFKKDLLIEDLSEWIEDNKLDYCIHLAANTGGIVYNRLNKDKIFFDNTIIGLRLLNALQHSESLIKCLSVTTSCTMPDKLEDYTEDKFHNGPPNKSVEFFAYGKRNVEIYGRALNEQYGNKFATVCVTNLFGPGDSSDLDKTKVVGAIIIKMLKAKKDGAESLTLFGDGSPLRDFLYVGDAARYIVDSLFFYEDYTMPLNIGSNTEISIRELAEKIKDVVGWEGKIWWDASKPNGQYRKMLNTDRMDDWLEIDNTPFEDAIKNTVKYYEQLHSCEYCTSWPIYCKGSI